MTEYQVAKHIIDALNGIRDEIKRMNENLERFQIDIPGNPHPDVQKIIWPDQYIIRDPMPGEYPEITCESKPDAYGG